VRASVLVTGAAGFIGYHVAARLLADGHEVVGLDNLNPYYDPALKRDRLALLAGSPAFAFRELDLADGAGLAALFAAERPEIVIHLAAQAGVRHSLTHPHDYARSNLSGFLNLLEACRAHPVRHLIYASSSSVYGASPTTPFKVEGDADHPLSLYAATKRANEMMAHAYSHLFRIAATGLRFFTVYGPWGRPDMAMWLFTEAIAAGRPIKLFNHGHMERDFTYIDDIVEGVVRLVAHPPKGEAPSEGSLGRAPHQLFNIGNSRPERVTDVVALIEAALGRQAERELLPMQPGDVPRTCADVTDLERLVGFRPATPIAVGVERFVTWYRERYGV
jgi:UDP-glucuronate 4-epimerase